MHYCYIVYSQSSNRYYIGETNNFSRRLVEHNTHFFNTAYSKIACDWTEYLIFELPDISIARSLERRIKKMKSRKFIERLKKDIDFRKSILDEILLLKGRLVVKNQDESNLD